MTCDHNPGAKFAFGVEPQFGTQRALKGRRAMEDLQRNETIGGGGRRFRVVRCQAGCFHLIWRHNITLHFIPSQIRKLLECLEFLLDRPPVASMELSWCRGYRDGHGFYNLLLYEDAIVLRLKEEESAQLRQALEHFS